MSLSTLNLPALNTLPRDRVYGRPAQYINITDPEVRTSGTAFIPSSPIGEDPLREDNWTQQDEKDFDRYVKDDKCRFILTASTRSLYKYHLENPTAKVRGTTAKERQNDWNAKSAAIAGYLLQDGQIYCQAEWNETTGKMEPPKYVTTYADTFAIIAAAHENLLHFSRSTPSFTPLS